MGSKVIEAGVPELSDGGYWYVVEVVTDPDLGGKTPGSVPGTGWCAWYWGDLAVVRCPEAVAVPSPEELLVKDVLAGAGYTSKPLGRVRGS